MCKIKNFIVIILVVGSSINSYSQLSENRNSTGNENILEETTSTVHLKGANIQEVINNLTSNLN